jgi:2-iminobutanoate/2-iminopropanoate deaminase
MRQSLGLLVVVGLLGAAAMSTGGAQAQAPAKKAYNGVVKPIGPYTPGVGVGNTLYLSGQIGLDPATSQLVAGGTEAEARRVMENLGAVLKEAGLDYGHVVKATIFMTDLAEFAKVNEIYGTFFPAGGVPPVRSTVQVAALPRGAHIEIDFIAVR